MELDSVRKELNKYDEAIKNLITLRMSLIPIVADIKIKNNLPLFQGKREEEIYKKIEIFAKERGVSENLVKDIYKLIISNALEIEENISQRPDSSVTNKEIDISNIENIKRSFQKLDTILNEEIPNIISEIINSENLENLTLTDKATIYYNEKINK